MTPRFRPNFQVVIVVASMVALSVAAMTSVSLADDVPFSRFDQNPIGEISFEEFRRAVAAASSNGGGRINFDNRTYTTRNDLDVNQPNVRLQGRSRTRIQRVATAQFQNVINISANNVTVSRIRISGSRAPTFNGSPLEREGLAPSTGVQTGIAVSGSALNFRCSGCRFERVNLGIDFRGLPNGARLTNCRFTTIQGMIRSLNEATRNATRIRRRFIFDNCDYVNAGDVQIANRGIILDFGNVPDAPQTIDLRGSIIRNCDMPIFARWQIGLNRLRNVSVLNNRLNGGGAFGRQRFVHCLHFEDGSSNITIRGNRLNQISRSGLTLTDHIWAGGNAVGTVNLGNLDTVRSNNTFVGLGGPVITIRPRRFGPAGNP